MLLSLFATKLNMTQVWSKSGRRIPVTLCYVANNIIVGHEKCSDSEQLQVKQLALVGYGKKKQKNLSKPLASMLKKANIDVGVRQIRGVEIKGDELPEVGSIIDLRDVLEVGDVVSVQGSAKGRGFAGVVKRFGFRGGPRTHGQSDRTRAVGAIGCRTTPGRVWRGKRMPGHYGTEVLTVSGLTVLHIDDQHKLLWLSGPIPGFYSSTVKITKTSKKNNIELDQRSFSNNPYNQSYNNSKTSSVSQVDETSETSKLVEEQTGSQESVPVSVDSQSLVK